MVPTLLDPPELESLVAVGSALVVDGSTPVVAGPTLVAVGSALVVDGSTPVVAGPTLVALEVTGSLVTGGTSPGGSPVGGALVALCDSEPGPSDVVAPVVPDVPSVVGSPFPGAHATANPATSATTPATARAARPRP